MILSTIPQKFCYANDGDYFYFIYDGKNLIEDGFKVKACCGIDDYEEHEGKWINHSGDYGYPDADNRDYLIHHAKMALDMAQILEQHSNYTENEILTSLNLEAME